MLKNSLSVFVGVSLALTGFAGAEDKKEAKKEPAPVAAKKAAGLSDPSKATAKAPDKFKAKFATTAGDFTIEVTREWSPLGADRFYNLIQVGFFEDIAIFRAIEGFMAQFGIHGDPTISTVWKNAKLQDDSKGKASNKPGTISFATAGPNTRTTQMFINFGDNSRLDGMGFTPFGKVVEGMANVNKIYKGYGEGAPRGRGPGQGRVQSQGNAYLKKDFPKLTYIKSVTIVKD